MQELSEKRDDIEEALSTARERGAQFADIRLESSGRGASYAISGPLDQPHVEPVQSPHSEAKAR